MKKIIETPRLILQEFTTDDATFMLELFNTKLWIQFIGDRNVKTVEEAEQYLLNGYMKSYQTHGFGFYKVMLKDTNEAIGICGIIKRDYLEDVDIGFAFLPQFLGKGYGFEAASATLDYTLNTLKIKRLIAIVNPENEVSIGLIKKIGLQFEKLIKSGEEELMLFGIGVIL
jgi:[ribosomal protein S5]-alanine N-acetyltransferase